MRLRPLLSVLFCALIAAPVQLRADSAALRIDRSRLFAPEEILRAYQQGYPDRIERVAFREGDWAVEIDGGWFFWAGGRLLPEAARLRQEEYSPYAFYPYSAELSPLPDFDSAQVEALRERIRLRESNPPRRHPGFLNALWRLDNRDSSWARMKTTFFLGYKVEIHRELLEDLAAVEEAIQRRIPQDDELRRFVAGIAQATAYNWRAIAGTASLSAHSYGTAIDIIPKSYGGRQAYWRWAGSNYPDWFLLPYEKRFHPPDAFIEAFERNGFIWGGKWFYFDTIHFEYRPEILLLSGLLESGRR